MRKTKTFILIAMVVLMLLLSGCDMISGREHSHNLIWINGNNPKMAFQFCTGCLRKIDTEDIYKKTLTIGMPDWGSMPAVAPPIGYDIVLDSGMYGYNEEISINLNLYFYYPYYIHFSDGDLHIKIAESEYYEIVGRDEYVEENFNSEKAKSIEKLSYKFTIKATEPCNSVEKVEFKIKANINDTFWNGTTGSIGDPAGWSCDNSEEYCFIIFALGFMNDSQGIILNEYDQRIFYDSINREYLSGILSKDDYVYKVYEFYLKDRPVIDVDYIDDKYSKPYFKYYSKNMRAEFYLTSSCEHFMSLYNNTENPVESNIELKKGLVKILLDEGYISNEEYEREIKYIEGSKSEKGLRYFSYDIMPIARYVRKNKVDYIYRETEGIDNSGDFNSSEGNIASLYLSNDRIDVGGEVNVSIYTEFSDVVKEYVIETQHGFSISS